MYNKYEFLSQDPLGATASPSTARKLPVAAVACSALNTGWSRSPSAPATVSSHQIRAGAARAQPAGRARPKSQNIPNVQYSHPTNESDQLEMVGKSIHSMQCCILVCRAACIFYCISLAHCRGGKLTGTAGRAPRAPRARSARHRGFSDRSGMQANPIFGF